MSSPSVPQPLDNPVTEFTNEQLYWNGFCQFLDCAADNDPLDAGEFAAMSRWECKGYADALAGADYAEFVAYRYSRNRYDDFTNY